MKISPGLLLSLALNAGLAGTVFCLCFRPTPWPVGAGTTTSQADTPTKPVSRNAKKGLGADESAPGPTAPVRFTWRELESPDLKIYIARLRAIECPEETIRDIIVAAVDELYAAKTKALRTALKSRKYRYWEATTWEDDDSRQFRRKQDELQKERRALLQELLGFDPDREWARQHGVTLGSDSAYSFLPEGKRDQVRAIAERFRDLEQDLNRKYKTFHDEETEAEHCELRAQRRTELAKILSPQELDEYDLRFSPIASVIQWEMETFAFDASEAEYRALFRAKAAMSEKVGDLARDPPLDEEGGKKYYAARKAMEEQLRADLGEKRFTEYQRGQLVNYQQLLSLARRESLPPDTAGKIFDMKDAAEAQVEKLHDDASLTTDQRKALLKGIQIETEKSIGAILGADVLKQYRSQPAGEWVRDLGR